MTIRSLSVQRVIINVGCDFFAVPRSVLEKLNMTDKFHPRRFCTEGFLRLVVVDFVTLTTGNISIIGGTAHKCAEGGHDSSVVVLSRLRRTNGLLAG